MLTLINHRFQSPFHYTCLNNPLRFAFFHELERFRKLHHSLNSALWFPLWFKFGVTGRCRLCTVFTVFFTRSGAACSYTVSEDALCGPAGAPGMWWEKGDGWSREQTWPLDPVTGSRGAEWEAVDDNASPITWWHGVLPKFFSCEFFGFLQSSQVSPGMSLNLFVTEQTSSTLTITAILYHNQVRTINNMKIH